MCCVNSDKDRCPAIYGKDVMPPAKGGKGQFTPLWQGPQYWKDRFAAGHDAGVQWFIYEQYSINGSPFDWPRQDLEFMVKNLWEFLKQLHICVSPHTSRPRKAHFHGLGKS